MINLNHFLGIEWQAEEATIFFALLAHVFFGAICAITDLGICNRFQKFCPKKVVGKNSTHQR